MNQTQVIKQLQQQYPGKTIICLPEDNPTEILCEIDPSSNHQDYSVVISIIDKSLPHIHDVTTEEYEILKGTLTLFRGNSQFELHQGERITIHPHEVHYAVGNETWIKVTSHPGWTPTDHILIKE